jgi:hypothetical protein
MNLRTCVFSVLLSCCLLFSVNICVSRACLLLCFLMPPSHFPPQNEHHGVFYVITNSISMYIDPFYTNILYSYRYTELLAPGRQDGRPWLQFVFVRPREGPDRPDIVHKRLCFVRPRGGPRHVPAPACPRASMCNTSIYF